MKQRGVGHGRALYRGAALALAVAAIAAGCGGGDGTGGATSAPAGPTRITVREYDGERLVRTVELDCAARGGACDRVIALLPRLAPDPTEACTEIYGGPERRVVSGTAAGVPVSVEVTRVDGCQIARYDLLTQALG